MTRGPIFSLPSTRITASVTCRRQDFLKVQNLKPLILLATQPYVIFSSVSEAVTGKENSILEYLINHDLTVER